MKKYLLKFVLIYIATILCSGGLLAQTFALTITDQTPIAPLTNPTSTDFQPRYISGFGQDNSFTVFFEDRDNGNTISYNSTTTGPTGFTAINTATNIAPETHFCVKDWPITIGSINYNYRGWGAVGNNPNHNFYVSNDLSNWTLISTFQIPNAGGFTNARGIEYYGFHDVIRINGTYYAFGESNQGQTMICRSINGDDVWEAFDAVGGTSLTDGNLITPTVSGNGWTPTGSFVDLGHDSGYGLFYVNPYNDYLYLAINLAAKTSLSPAQLEAAFINPANWTWNNGNIGPADNPLLSETAEHDIRECWIAPSTNPDAEWVIIYDADFGLADGGKALGYTTATPPLPIPISNSALFLGVFLIIVFIIFRFRKNAFKAI